MVPSIRLLLLGGVMLLSITTILSQDISQKVSSEDSYYFSFETDDLLGSTVRLRSKPASIQVTLPMPDGNKLRFTAVANNVLPSSVESKFPLVRSFDLRSNSDPRIIGKLTVGADKIFATLFTPQGPVTISPSLERPGQFLSYYGEQHPEKEHLHQHIDGNCEQDENEVRAFEQKRQSQLRSGSGFSIGSIQRTYRMAIVVTGEFYQANSDNTNAIDDNTEVLAAVTFAVNGLNLIYENELSVNFTIVPDPILYTDPGTDPFTPDNSGGAGRTVQAANIVAANFTGDLYDLGHVLHNHSTGDGWSTGGVAGLGVLCNNTPSSSGLNKGRGWSGSFNNTTTGWIRLFAHEVGHMFSATHTFNGTGEACTSNISSNSSYEIGSGTTIMSYRGICQADNNIPGASGPEYSYFHANSLEQMVAHISVNPVGSSCAAESIGRNDEPIVDANPSGISYTIPARTPFELTGSAEDLQQTNLTYSWEQFDEDGTGTPTQGLIGSAAALNAAAPLFRSFAPTSSPTRTFPSLDSILAGDNLDLRFEALPKVSRSMTFAFTVRDNVLSGGAVACDQISLNVEDTGAPFEVTSQNGATNLLADGSSTFTVTWNVSGTTGGNINCANVDIYLSTDGGANFSYLLASSVPNNGTANIVIPNLPTTKGRIKVKGANHLFFDINNSDITISSTCSTAASTIFPKEDCSAAPGDPSLDLNLFGLFGFPVTSFTGTLENPDPTSPTPSYNNTDNQCNPFNANAFYETYPIKVSETGTYRFFSNLGFKGMAMYQGSFDPINTCTNWIGSAIERFSNGGLQIANDFQITLTAGVEYTFFINSVRDDYVPGLGDYNISVSGPGEVFISNAGLGAGTAYTFVIVDENTGDIKEFVDDPDLSNPANYPSGCYSIYGLSYETMAFSVASLNSTYQNTSFATFQGLALNQSICVNLSINTKEVVILGCGAEGAVLSPASTVNDFEGSDGLDLTLTPDYTGLSTPGAGFGYTYMVLNAADLKILAFQDNPDLSNPANFPAGEYRVYGLSYSTSGSQTSATLFATYGNQSWAPLRNDILDKTICADTSSNFVQVNVIECKAEGATFSPDGALGADPGDPVLDLALSPDYGNTISSFTGSIENTDPTSVNLAVEQMGGCVGVNSSYYETHTFFVSTSGTYIFSLSSPFGQVINVYEGNFDPNNICTNWKGSSADFPDPMGSVLLTGAASADLVAGVQYTLVIQTFNTSNPNYLGAYTITPTGPGDVLDNLANPGSDYQYTYVIVDESNGNIKQVSDDPDLSNTGIYPMGQYLIYGLSFEKTISGFTTGGLNTNLVGTSFNNFRASLVGVDTCADLSSNTKTIIIVDCDAEAGAITASDTVRAYQGGSVLNLTMAPDYTGVSDPGSAFSYAYIIASKTTGEILEIVDAPDLTDGVTYGVDTFHIYGLSFANDTLSSAQLNTTYQGEDFSNLDSLINARFICADLSSNLRPVIILPCEPNAATFAPSTNLTAEFNDPSLALSLNPEYGNLITSFSGVLDDAVDPQSFLAVNGSMGGCQAFGNDPYYDVYAFQVNQAGTYTFARTSGSSKVISLYDGPFQPNFVCTDFVISASTFNGSFVNINSIFEASLQAYTTYYLTVNNFAGGNSGALGAYEISISGPGQAYDSNAAPSSKYNYTYVVVENTSSEIVLISPNPDLSDGTEFPVGDFTVYGLSYETSLNNEASLVNDFVDESMTTLQNAIAANAVCGQLSANTRAITITNANLPVELLTFELENKSNSVDLKWATSTESQNKGFNVERSADGIQWEKLGFVAGAGNSQVRQDYQFEDSAPLLGTSFYRLQQLDFDGTEAYSEIRTNNRSGILSGFNIFPNPSKGIFNYQIGNLPKESRIIVTNQLGQVLQVVRPIDANDKIDLSSEKAGVYFFTLENTTGSTTLRAVKLD